ncbi:hypothetical protein ASG41_14040 [Modestobacter sp. Leaf380]|nr:hypothetical protein ASG41_14040 [Modestobacter sp. Leaf380]
MHLDPLPPDPLPPDPPGAGSGRLQSVLALLQHLLPAHTARVAQVPPGHRCTDDRSPRDDEPTRVPLVTGDGREVGHLLLRARDGRPPGPGRWQLLGQVLPLLAEEVDPMRAVLDAVRRVPDVVAGAVLAPDGGCLEIPGLEPHPLLHAGSPVAAAASERIGVCRLGTSFLWPTGARGAALGHVRVTALDTGAPAADHRPPSC